MYFNEEDVLITRISSTFHLAEQRVSSSSWAGPGSGAVVTTEGGWTRQRGKWTECGGSLTNKTFPASHRIPATEFLHEPLSPADTRHQSQAAANVTLLVHKTMFINGCCCQFSCNNHLSNVSVSCLTAATLRLSGTKITSFKLLAAACRRDT